MGFFQKGIRLGLPNPVDWCVAGIGGGRSGPLHDYVPPDRLDFAVETLPARDVEGCDDPGVLVAGLNRAELRRCITDARFQNRGRAAFPFEYRRELFSNPWG